MRLFESPSTLGLSAEWSGRITNLRPSASGLVADHDPLRAALYWVRQLAGSPAAREPQSIASLASPGDTRGLQPTRRIFGMLASTNPRALAAWIDTENLDDGALALATESLAAARTADLVMSTAGPLLCHEAPMVREAAIRALEGSFAEEPWFRAAMERIRAQDPSPGVRAAAEDAIAR